MRFFIRRWQAATTFLAQEMIQIFAASLFVFLLATHSFGLIISILFQNLERNFNLNTFLHVSFSRLLDGCIYGSFLLAYSYYQKNKKHQQKLSVYHQSMAENRIKQLKTQLNPHFLFNNLNVLDELIQEDKHKASEFLYEFSEIYRYVLQASDKPLTSISEELVFAEQYFALIQYKYGKAYRLSVQIQDLNGYIIPLTLQLLIENAVQHNIGSIDQPVMINIEPLSEDRFRVTNNLQPKKHGKATSGRALNNLREQYAIMTHQYIEIQKTDTHFSVIVPAIQKPVLT
jgi:LytS/YehU family sensor histidine kinase